jgi:hypothetical protein
MARGIALTSAAIASSSISASLLNPKVPSRVDVMSNGIAISYSRLFYTSGTLGARIDVGVNYDDMIPLSNWTGPSSVTGNVPSIVT